jgi:hypothetical protein
MQQRFTQSAIARFRRSAKESRRGTSLTQEEALDQIAQRKGWLNWELLHKNSIPPGPGECLDLWVEPFKPGDPGVFFFKLKFTDPKTWEALERRGDASFELPKVPANWIIRQFTQRLDPYLDRRMPWLRGRFVSGKFLCIVSVNGVEPRDVDAEVAKSLMPLCAAIRAAATQGTEMWMNTPAEDRVKLYVSRRREDGVCEVDELSYLSVADAQGAAFQGNIQPIGIPTPEGWWTYQAPFGWQSPAA